MQQCHKGHSSLHSPCGQEPLSQTKLVTDFVCRSRELPSPQSGKGERGWAREARRAWEGHSEPAAWLSAQRSARRFGAHGSSPLPPSNLSTPLGRRETWLSPQLPARTCPYRSPRGRAPPQPAAPAFIASSPGWSSSAVTPHSRLAGRQRPPRFTAPASCAEQPRRRGGLGAARARPLANSQALLAFPRPCASAPPARPRGESAPWGRPEPPRSPGPGEPARPPRPGPAPPVPPERGSPRAGGRSRPGTDAGTGANTARREREERAGGGGGARSGLIPGGPGETPTRGWGRGAPPAVP